MQIGTTKDQGLYNKLQAVVHPGALAAGTLPQYNTIQYNVQPFEAHSSKQYLKSRTLSHKKHM